VQEDVLHLFFSVESSSYPHSAITTTSIESSSYPHSAITTTSIDRL
jgi:hypothetical protein